MNFQEIKRWYNGYSVTSDVPLKNRKERQSGESYAIYSPISVVSAALTGKVLNYWNETETADALKEYISELNHDNVNYKYHSCVIERA